MMNFHHDALSSVKPDGDASIGVENNVHNC